MRILPMALLHYAALVFFLGLGVPLEGQAVTIQRLSPTGPQPTVTSPQGREHALYVESHALLISVSDYMGAARGGWRRLENTGQEMDQLASVLQKHGFHIWRVSDPTGIELVEVFRNFMAQYGHSQDNRLLFFFSGHGYTNPTNDFGYLVPVNAKDPSQFPAEFYATALPIQQIELWAREIEARHAIFFFDSCFSGSIFATRSGFTEADSRGDTASERWRFLTEQSKQPVRQFIAAGGAKEELPARSEFVPLLIKALEHGNASNRKDGYVTGKEIGTWLAQTLPNINRSQNPHSDVIRDSRFVFGDMVFQLQASRSPQNQTLPTRPAEVDIPADGDAQVVTIGHVGPTSGALAHLGKDNENGARMAIDHLNAKGITFGGKKVRFQLLAEDDAADPKKGNEAAQKLVQANVSGVIGHLNSGTTIPASKIYNDARIPQISPSATNPKYTNQGFDTAFRLIADDGKLARMLGYYAVDKLNARKIAVIDDRTAYGSVVADEFVKAVKSKGAEVVTRQYTDDKATDHSGMLNLIKSKNPDTIFFGGLDTVAGPMLRQMKQLGIDAKYLGGDGICTNNLKELSGGTIDDDRVICGEAGGVLANGVKGMEDFKTEFKEKFGMNVQLYAPYTYDAVMAMAHAMEKAGSAEPEKYLPMLANESYDGVTGRISFDSKGDIKSGIFTLYTYRGNNREQIGVVEVAE